MNTKEVFETNPVWGKPVSERSIYEHMDLGIINLDKPPGPSSHQVSSWVKDILGVKKAGHSGTLDPGVSGVLPVCLNRATKIVETLLLSSKAYMTLMKLHSDIPESEIMAAMKHFEGEIIQTPPVKSAVKRRPRKRTIHSLKVLEMDGRYVLFSAEVQAGTYIRKLCHDMGIYLGTRAHMSELRRVKAGPFMENTSRTLHELSEAWNIFAEEGNEAPLRAMITPVEEGVSHLPKIYAKDSAVSALCHGARLSISGISKLSDFKKDEVVAFFTLKDELIGTGKSLISSKDIMGNDKGVSSEIKSVVMDRDIYPKMWKE